MFLEVIVLEVIVLEVIVLEVIVNVFRGNCYFV